MKKYIWLVLLLVVCLAVGGYFLVTGIQKPGDIKRVDNIPGQKQTDSVSVPPSQGDTENSTPTLATQGADQQQIVTSPSPDGIDTASTQTTTNTDGTDKSNNGEIILPTTGEVPGNNESSLATGGSAATDGTYEYFWATSGPMSVVTGEKGHLCRMKPDGTDCKILIQDDVYDINIVGEWVYYIKSDDLYGRGCICRIKKEGGASEIIYNFKCQQMTIVGDTIYFINVSDNSTVYSMKTDGTQAVQLCDIQSCGNLQYENGSLFFARDNDNKVYSYSLTDKKLNEINADGLNSIFNGWIYYWKDYAIYRIREDGTQKEKLIENSTSFVVLSDKIIYLSSIIDEKEPDEGYGLRKLYCYNIGTKETTVIPNDNKERIFGFAGVAGDYIYYWVDYREYEDIKRMKIDGTEVTNIFDKAAKSQN